MFSKYADLENDTLKNYSSILAENSYGISLIFKIYINTKNCIDYIPDNVLQKASETLVMGRGNNFSKNILLYSLLKISGFECELNYKYIVDNTKVIACRNNSIIPWFYVNVYYLDKKLEMDCSLDRSYKKSAGVLIDGNEMEYSVEKYKVKNKRAFSLLPMDVEDSEDYVLNILSRRGVAGVYSRSRGIGYV